MEVNVTLAGKYQVLPGTVDKATITLTREGAR